MSDVAQDPKHWKEDWYSDVFESDDFISINSIGGNVGRFYWVNQSSLVVESWDADRDPYAPGAAFWWINAPSEVTTIERSGCCAFIWTLGDWWAWLME